MKKWILFSLVIVLIFTGVVVSFNLKESVEIIEKIDKENMERDNSQNGKEESEFGNVGTDGPEIKHDFFESPVNNVEHNSQIIIVYDGSLKDSVSLESLTIFLSNGGVYFFKDLSDAQVFEVPVEERDLMLYIERIRIKYDEIFYGNFLAGNEEWLDIELKYYQDDDLVELTERHLIKVTQSSASFSSPFAQNEK